MSENALHQLYYRFQDSAIDMFMPKDCREKCIYVIVKSIYQIPDLLHAFFDDITLYLVRSADGSIVVLDVLNSKTKIDFFKLESNETRGDESAKLLDGLLDKGELVIIQTVVEKLPFLSMYSPEFDIRKFQPMHTFVVIHHDRENYYYVDAPCNLNPERFVAYKGSREVGVAPKSDFDVALRHYMRSYTVRLLPENIARMDCEIPKRIEEAVVNYRRCSESKNGTVTVYGRAALEILIALCESEKMSLNETIIANNNPLPLHQLIRWKIGGDLTSRRRLLYKVLSGYCTKYKIASTGLFIEHAKNLMDSWEIFNNTMEIRCMRKRYLLDASFGKQLRKPIDMEDRIIDEMSEIFLKNSMQKNI